MGVVKVVFEVVICYFVVDFGECEICVNIISVGLMWIIVVCLIFYFGKFYNKGVMNVVFGCNVIFEEVGKFVLFLFFDFSSGIIG